MPQSVGLSGGGGVIFSSGRSLVLLGHWYDPNLPGLKTSSSKDSVAFCHMPVLSRGQRPLQHPTPLPSNHRHLSLASLQGGGGRGTAKYRPLLPRIEPPCIPRHAPRPQETDLVRCLLEACTSISVLLNSFSSLRMAACRELWENKTAAVH